MQVETWTHRPAPPLDRWIESMWLTLSDVPLYRRLRVFPDGHMLVMFNLGGPQGAIDGRGSVLTFRRAWVCGSCTRPLDVVAGADHRILGVRFRPGGAKAFFTEEMRAFTDQVVELDTIWPGLPEELTERLESATAEQAFALVCTALRARARCDGLPGELIDAAVDRLVAKNGNVKVEQLAHDLGISRRHLLRAFDERVGLTPKVAARVFRFQAVIRRVAAAREDWGQLVQRFGYYDQAHFIHEFRDLAGMTPSEYALAVKAEGEGVITA